MSVAIPERLKEVIQTDSRAFGVGYAFGRDMFQSKHPEVTHLPLLNVIREIEPINEPIIAGTALGYLVSEKLFELTGENDV